MNKERDERLLEMSAPSFDATAALTRFHEGVAARRITPRVSRTDAIVSWLAFTRSSWLRPAIAVVATLVLVGTAAFTGVADTVLTIFEPKQVATVTVDPSQLHGIPDPSRYGTLTWITRPEMHQVADGAAAAKDAGFTPLVPASLPSGIPAQARFGVMSEGKATFRFDEAKAGVAAAEAKATIPPMPSAIAATTLTMTGGPAILQRYGAAASGVADTASLSAGPQLIVVQAKAPLVTSNGATVQELRDYALAQPGIPPALAAQIRAIGDPVRTLLVPIGVDVQHAQVVTVRGTQGYLVGDQTGLGSGVFWLERGYVIAVFGSLKQSDLLALVNALH